MIKEKDNSSFKKYKDLREHCEKISQSINDGTLTK